MGDEGLGGVVAHFPPLLPAAMTPPGTTTSVFLTMMVSFVFALPRVTAGSGGAWARACGTAGQPVKAQGPKRPQAMNAASAR